MIRWSLTRSAGLDYDAWRYVVTEPDSTILSKSYDDEAEARTALAEYATGQGLVVRSDGRLEEVEPS